MTAMVLPSFSLKALPVHACNLQFCDTYSDVIENGALILITPAASVDTQTCEPS